MSQETQTDLIKAINRLAEAIEKMGKTYVSSPVVPTTKKPKTNTQQSGNSKDKETLAVTITSEEPHEFNNKKGVFYKGTIVKSGHELDISLGVHYVKCDITFAKGQVVKCLASYAGVDDYGESQYWLSKLLEIDAPFPEQFTEQAPQTNEEENNEEEDQDVPF